MITTQITLKGEMYALRASTAAAIYYEQVTGKPFELDTLTDNFMYFWCMVLASNRDKPVIGFIDFVDALDESPDALKAFEELLTDLRARNSLIEDSTVSDNKKKE